MTYESVWALRERSSRAMQHKRDQGEYTCRHERYGWRRDTRGDRLRPHAPEQAIVRQASSLREARLLLRAIGGRLVADGNRPRVGGRWHAKTVRVLLEARAA